MVCFVLLLIAGFCWVVWLVFDFASYSCLFSAVGFAYGT